MSFFDWSKIFGRKVVRIRQKNKILKKKSAHINLELNKILINCTYLGTGSFSLLVLLTSI